jgi:Skp family chaperone for outer membrane proteins
LELKVRSMKKCIIALAVAIAALTGGNLISMPPAFAQENAKDVPIVIGTLDWQIIQTQSKAGKSLVAELQKRAKAVNADVSKKEQAIRAKRQQLEQSRASLQPADYDAKRKAIDSEFEALRKDSNAKRKDLEKARNAGFEQILKALDGVIRDVANKRGLTLILHRSAVVLGPDVWDITEEVKKALDAKLPAVKI